MEVVTNLFNEIISTLQTLGSWIAIIALCVGGYQFFSKNPNSIENGKQTMLYAGIGFVIIKLAPDIIKLIEKLAGQL